MNTVRKRDSAAGNPGLRRIRRPVAYGLAFLGLVIFFHSFLSTHSSIAPAPEVGGAKSGHPTDTRPPIRTTPACDIWPGWRTKIPSTAAPNDSVLTRTRLGTAEVFGGSSEHGCVPASERLGPFDHTSGNVFYSQDHPPWESVQWGKLQNDCRRQHHSDFHLSVLPSKLQWPPENADEVLANSEQDLVSTGRQAVVLRGWNSYVWTGNRLAWVRNFITELSLDTGGQYQVFILLDVHDADLDLTDDESYSRTLASIPQEFRDIALPFNERFLRAWFPKVGMYTFQDQAYQAVQLFSYSFPEFDYVWQVELDARFTGNLATHLNTAASWAQKQPRKHLWERNARWYIPELWKHNYTFYSEQLDLELSGYEGVWGPPAGASLYVTPEGPVPPGKDDLSWGVGESAELINFAPVIDPKGTRWIYEDAIHNFENPENLPRRMAMVSMTRTSRRLLRLISLKQRQTGSWVVSESTPETWAYLHGLKAVYVPHLVTFDFSNEVAPEKVDHGELTPHELDKKINTGPPSGPAGGYHTTFLWSADGYLPADDPWRDASYFYWAGVAPTLWWDYTNGSCTYPMFVHPVKDD